MGTRSDERAGFLGDIITTAVEGGTGYWAQVSQYQWVDTAGFLTDAGEDRLHVSVGERVGDETRATLHEMNDDETGYKDEALELTIAKVATAVRKIADGKIGVHGAMFEAVTEASRENDAGMIDAWAADAIAQVALLGKVVYG